MSSHEAALTNPRNDRFEPVPVKVRSYQRARRRLILTWSGSDLRLGRVRAEALSRAQQASKSDDPTKKKNG